MVRPKKISDEELLEIARDCFLQSGPQVSTQEIADRSITVVRDKQNLIPINALYKI